MYQPAIALVEDCDNNARACASLVACNGCCPTFEATATAVGAPIPASSAAMASFWCSEALLLELRALASTLTRFPPASISDGSKIRLAVPTRLGLASDALPVTLV